MKAEHKGRVGVTSGTHAYALSGSGGPGRPNGIVQALK